ncbi:hypothetical protein Hdeb2414_s0008g00294251 [Helianthus debilis subsp. tardiflorus]
MTSTLIFFGSVGFLGQRIIEDEFGDCGLLTKFTIDSDKSDDERRFFGLPIFGDKAAVYDRLTFEEHLNVQLYLLPAFCRSQLFSV